MSNSKYQKALDRLCENDYFDEKGNCNCDQIVMDRILLQELVDKATPKNPILVMHGKVKMTANEMFEELGFKYKKYNEDFAYECIKDGKTEFVHFITERQTYCTNIYHVSTQLHNAITAQMKELERI